MNLSKQKYHIETMSPGINNIDWVIVKLKPSGITKISKF